MPFGLKNAPETFQRLMYIVLTGLEGTEFFLYLDDIVLYAETLEEHEEKFDELMNRLRKSDLHLQADNREFLRPETVYLRHIMDKNEVRSDPKKIKSILEFSRPKHKRNIKQFLGSAGYYRRFMNNFFKIASPLTYLLKKNTPFVWTEKQQTAFDTLEQ